MSIKQVNEMFLIKSKELAFVIAEGNDKSLGVINSMIVKGKNFSKIQKLNIEIDLLKRILNK